MRIKGLAFRIANSKVLERTIVAIGIATGVAAILNPLPQLVTYIVSPLLLVLLVYSIAPIASRGYGIKWLLEREWHCYHLTRDDTREGAYWVEGKIEFLPASTYFNLKAVHIDVEPPRHTYAMKGYIKNGAMLFFEENENNSKKDDCLAYFPSLRSVHSEGMKNTKISGFWMGPDQMDQNVVGPYILSATKLGEIELFQSTKIIRSLTPENPAAY